MPALENQRHERFAQELAKGNSASEAYVNSGYKESRSAACRLSANVNIAARVAELQGKAAQKVVVTIETIAAQLDEDRELAHRVSQPTAAVAASMSKAKLYGLAPDKHIHSGPNDGPIQQEISSVDALTGRITGLAARTGQDGVSPKPH